MTRPLFESVDLYPVLTPSLCGGREPLHVVSELLKGGAKVLQLRVKEQLNDRDHLELARKARTLTAAHGALLIIDDRLDIALAAHADGIHLGLDDLPITVARSLAPDLIIGASSHNLQEAMAAQEQGASYVNIGPIYATRTKSLPMEPLGPEAIDQIAPALKIPFTVMGGIKLEHIPELTGRGARHIAMVTALTEAPDIAESVRAFRAAMGFTV